jgi:DNA-binding response OmpR family regulator
VEMAAEEAGCDGFITKPFDPDALTSFVRANLRRPKAPSVDPPGVQPIPGEKRRAFLENACEQCRMLISSLDAGFQPALATRMLRGLREDANQYGYSSIPQLAHDAEELLDGISWNRQDLERNLGKLLAALVGLKAEAEAAVVLALAAELKAMRIALAGFDATDAARIGALAEKYGATTQIVASPGETIERGMLQGCDVAIIHAGDAGADAFWLSPEPSGVPLILAGGHRQLTSLDPRPRSQKGREILIDDWQSDEALLRVGLTVSRATVQRTYSRAIQGAQPAILIVDDDASIRRLLQVDLESLGMRCLVAGDGEEARRLLGECPPDAAIVDLNLPGMDGFELIRSIRVQAPGVRIMLLTGRDAERDILQGFRMGANDYLTKPFNRFELTARLQRLLSVRNTS